MRHRILVADDSITIQKVIALTFANEDFELDMADNGDEAFEKAKSIAPDLIIADTNMPGLSGYDLCEKIRSVPDLATIPIILLAGTYEIFNDARAAQVRASDHLTKPFESKTLIEKVHALLKTQDTQSVQKLSTTSLINSPDGQDQDFSDLNLDDFESPKTNAVVQEAPAKTRQLAPETKADEQTATKITNEASWDFSELENFLNQETKQEATTQPLPQEDIHIDLDSFFTQETNTQQPQTNAPVAASEFEFSADEPALDISFQDELDQTEKELATPAASETFVLDDIDLTEETLTPIKQIDFVQTSQGQTTSPLKEEFEFVGHDETLKLASTAEDEDLNLNIISDKEPKTQPQSPSVRATSTTVASQADEDTFFADLTSALLEDTSLPDELLETLDASDIVSSAEDVKKKNVAKVPNGHATNQPVTDQALIGLIDARLKQFIEKELQAAIDTTVKNAFKQSVDSFLNDIKRRLL